jgi:hypothetical protein
MRRSGYTIHCGNWEEILEQVEGIWEKTKEI